VKRLAIFPSQVSTAGTQVYADFARSTGWQLEENSWDADAVVIWSVLWHGRMTKNQPVYEHYRKQKKPVIIIETGVLKRNETFKVCVNETDRYGAYWDIGDDSDPDRVYRMLGHINQIQGGDKILICGQNPFSRNWKKYIHEDSNETMEEWVRSKVAWARAWTDRPIEIRPHPRYSLRIPDLQDLVVDPKFTVKDDTDLVKIFEDCFMVINYNSYPGIQARLHGLHTSVHHSSLAAITNTNDIHDDNQDSWLNFMARTEFTHDEIRSGFAWDKIRYAVDISQD
jgi:hypothetical protein